LVLPAAKRLEKSRAPDRFQGLSPALLRCLKKLEHDDSRLRGLSTGWAAACDPITILLSCGSSKLAHDGEQTKTEAYNSKK